jgi:hypothetical protein
MAQARAQMKRLFGANVDKSRLETGGKGSLYVKVWRDKPLALYLWFWFDTTTEGEQVAYERAVQAMADNPGARWAVSGQCGYACAGLPRLWNVPFENGPLLDLSIVALGELYAAKSKGLIVEKHNDDTYLILADHGFAFEVEPSKWRITDTGKQFVEAKRDAVKTTFVEVANG